MARTIGIGAQGFEGIRANGYFYVDGLVEHGIAPVRIRTYAIAFRGKEVLVG